MLTQAKQSKVDYTAWFRIPPHQTAAHHNCAYYFLQCARPSICKHVT